ncbi:MAG: hypothetical protein RBJ76_02555 [Stenomitos frigidus ULC029]
MAYADRPMERFSDHPAAIVSADYHDRVRWGPIFAGLVVAISTQLILSSLGAAIGLTTIANSGAPRSNAGDVGSAVGIWSIISLLISLFVGGWVTARTCGPMSKSTALLNGAILWATVLAASAWLLASGVSGAFGVLASNAGEVANQVQQPGGVGIPNNIPDTIPNVTAEQARDTAGNAAKAGWSFVLGSLLGLVAAGFGSTVGARKPRVITDVRE